MLSTCRPESFQNVPLIFFSCSESEAGGDGSKHGYEAAVHRWWGRAETNLDLPAAAPFALEGQRTWSEEQVHPQIRHLDGYRLHKSQILIRLFFLFWERDDGGLVFE